MATYAYKALNDKGKPKSGTMEADSPRQVRQQLREQSLIPVDVEEAEQQIKQSLETSGLSLFQFKRKVKTKDLSLLTRQLATMIAAALPLEEALKAVSEQCDKPKVSTVISAVRSRVIEGHTLADSMRGFPHVFDHLYCAMVAAGEHSGHLDKVLSRLADYIEQRQQLQSKLQQAMIYPTILTIVALGVVAFLLSSVVPTVIEQFRYMQQDLPTTTQILLSMSEFVTNWGLIVVSFLIMAFTMFRVWLRNPKHRESYHQRILVLPVVGRVSRGLNTARFARTLSILNSSAVPLLNAMGIASEVLTNTHARTLLLEATDMVREGSSIRVALENTKLFPPMMLYMIASGEQSGKLDTMLEHAANNQDQEFETQVNLALGIFQPVLIVCMALVVLFIVLAMLQPILQLNTLVGG